MDSRLIEALVRSDMESFTRLYQQDEEILEQRTSSSLSTALHIASKYGRLDLVKEIVRLRPQKVAAENKIFETPLHEACRQGNVEVVILLMEANPWVSCKLNAEKQSALFIACSNGHLEVVKFLLNQPWLLGIEEENVDLVVFMLLFLKGIQVDLRWKLENIFIIFS